MAENGKLTVAEAAERLGVTPRAVQDAITRKRLGAELVTPRAGRPYYLIPLSALEAYDRERRDYHPNKHKGG